MKAHCKLPLKVTHAKLPSALRFADIPYRRKRVHSRLSMFVLGCLGGLST